MKDGIGVWNVNDPRVGCYFRDKVTRVQVIRDGHAEAENQTVGKRVLELGLINTEER